MQEVFDIQRVALESRLRRNRQLRLLVPVFVLAIVAAIAESVGFLPGPVVDVDYVYWAVSVLVFAGLVYTLANWRWPAGPVSTTSASAPRSATPGQPSS